MGQCDFRLFAFRSEHDGDEGIAFIAFISPGVGEAFQRHGLGDAAVMDEVHALIAAGELEFVADFGFETRDGKAPLADGISIGEGVPDALDGGIEDTGDGDDAGFSGGAHWGLFSFCCSSFR